MSKIEEQKALPRRRLFRDGAKWDGVVIVPIVQSKPKRKAKKAKGKR